MPKFPEKMLFCCAALASVWASSFVAKAAEAAPTGESWAAAKILPAEPGRRVCYQRAYDARHLAAHPLQKITQMQFLLRAVGYDAHGDYVAKNQDHIVYEFALSLQRRGDSHAQRVNGDCLGDKIAQCVVDCDGGGVDIEKPAKGDGLLVRLKGEGIAFGNDCDTTRGRFVAPGADDKVFLLEPAPVESCAALEKEKLNRLPY